MATPLTIDVTTGVPGPQGPKGDTGAASTVPGPQGAKGDTGAASTIPGPKGDKGDTGATSTVPGPQGPPGSPGATGAASTVPGPQGVQGPQGVKGDKGDIGAASTVPGPAGQVLVVSLTQAAYDALPVKDPTTLYVITDAANRTVLSGTANPAAGNGLVGDYWINTTTWTISGPKAAGGWPAPVSLVGPQGVQGVQGIQGVQGPVGQASTVPGPQGAPGPTGPAGADSTVPGPQGVKGDTGAGSMTTDTFTPYGICPLPSVWMMSFTNPLTSGRLDGLFFICNTNRPCNRLAIMLLAAGAATPTLTRLAVYRYDVATGTMTLAASTTNNTALMVGTLGWRSDPITGGTEVVGGVWTPVPGAIYCTALLCVTAVAVPSVTANATIAAPYPLTLGAGKPVPMTFTFNAQADLPTSLVSTNTHLNAGLRGSGVYPLFA